MKRLLICMVLVVLCTAVFTACDGDSSPENTESVASSTTITESKAKDIAINWVKGTYARYASGPIVIGSTSASDKGDYWYVTVKGHYSKKDSYGYEATENFSFDVGVNKDGRIRFA